MKFPKEAEAVRKYIRDNVGKPKELPKMIGGSLSWVQKKGNCCPLGLCPKSMWSAPTRLSHFRDAPTFNQGEMITFFEWFDKLTDPQYAVDQVWGE